jgi:hypothetical protein
MRLRLNGSKIVAARAGETFGPQDPATRTREAAGASRKSGHRSVGFIYVIRGEHGLIKIGSTTDPVARLAELRNTSPFPLHVEYLCFMRADLYLKVEDAVQAALDRHRVNLVWFDCETRVAISAIRIAARRHGQGVIPTSIEGVEDAVQAAFLWPVLSRGGRLGRTSLRRRYGKAVTIGLACAAMGLLGFVGSWMSPNLHPLVVVGASLVPGLILGLFLSRT